MSNIESVVESYVASWNETDPARRQSALAASCAADARYRDPVMVSDGQAGLDAMLAGVQAKFPGFVLRRISKVDSHNDAVRFAWSLGPAAGPVGGRGRRLRDAVGRRQAREHRGVHRQDAGLTAGTVGTIASQKQPRLPHRSPPASSAPGIRAGASTSRRRWLRSVS